MDPKDIADLFSQATARIEFYWNFLVVALVAILGWLFTTNRALGTTERAAITVGYLIFAVMNIIGLYGAYTFADALKRDLLLSCGLAETLPNATAALGKVNYRLQRQIMFAVHALVAVILLTAIWKARPRPA
ncbi:MAG: hypothetical protein AAGC86_16385 [Pseudomonadota bacterium]